MSSRRLASVLAAVGASGALIAGGLAFGGSPASAASIPFSYNCTTPLGAETVTLAFDPATLPTLPTTWAAGVPMGAEVDPVLTLPAELTTAIVQYLGKDSIGGAVAATLGDSGIPINFTVPTTPLVAGQPVDITTPGKVGAPTKVGSEAVSLPNSLSATLAEFTIPCTLTSPNTTIGSINIIKDGSSTTAKAVKATVKAATKGKTKGFGVAKVVATVKNAAFQGVAGNPGTGKVVAKQGAKTLATGTLKGGKATLTLKKLTVGKHKIVVSYVGTSAVKGSSAKPVVIKVTK